MPRPHAGVKERDVGRGAFRERDRLRLEKIRPRGEWSAQCAKGILHHAFHDPVRGEKLRCRRDAVWSDLLMGAQSPEGGFPFGGIAVLVEPAKEGGVSQPFGIGDAAEDVKRRQKRIRQPFRTACKQRQTHREPVRRQTVDRKIPHRTHPAEPPALRPAVCIGERTFDRMAQSQRRLPSIHSISSNRHCISLSIITQFFGNCNCRDKLQNSPLTNDAGCAIITLLMPLTCVRCGKFRKGVNGMYHFDANRNHTQLHITHTTAVCLSAEGAFCRL